MTKVFYKNLSDLAEPILKVSMGTRKSTIAI